MKHMAGQARIVLEIRYQLPDLDIFFLTHSRAYPAYAADEGLVDVVEWQCHLLRM
jgi:hypothetical protein